MKRLIWGGRRLGDVLGKAIGPESDYAESWEIVDHGFDQSVVAEGPFAGKTLHDLVRDHRPWLLGSRSTATTFPLLLKYLDCQRVLSVQVHPEDSYASRMPQPDRGKTEAWYVIDAAQGSRIYAGLREGVTRSQLEQAIEAGTTETLLHSFEPTAGDCVFIPAGTVHAIGGGLLVAEIQQSSDTTFRIFDWNRTDASGKSRELHVAQSLEVIDFGRGPVNPISITGPTSGWQTLVRCDKFEFSSLCGATAEVAGDGVCHLLTASRGSAKIVTAAGEISVSLGETILVPAAMGVIQCSVDEASCLLEMRPVE